MKVNKWITILILSMFSMHLFACGSNSQGTYFPNSAEKGTDNIEFYWLDEMEAIDAITEEIKTDAIKLDEIKVDIHVGVN